MLLDIYLTGVYTGYSSLSWALTVPEDGKVVALDVSAEFAEVGKPVWKEAGVENKIDLRIGKAADSLSGFDCPTSILHMPHTM